MQAGQRAGDISAVMCLSNRNGRLAISSQEGSCRRGSPGIDDVCACHGSHSCSQGMVGVGEGPAQLLLEVAAGPSQA